MSDSETRPGHRIVVVVYVAVVAIAGAMGYLVGVVRPADIDPELFFLVQFPPTPLGVALYGMVTVGVVLGVGLGLVVAVSKRYDTDARR